jgi:hypothetical protein
MEIHLFVQCVLYTAQRCVHSVYCNNTAVLHSLYCDSTAVCVQCARRQYNGVCSVFCILYNIYYVLLLSTFGYIYIYIYISVWKLSRFEILCNLFGTVLTVHSARGIIYTVFRCNVLIISSFIS